MKKKNRKKNKQNHTNGNTYTNATVVKTEVKTEGKTVTTSTALTKSFNSLSKVYTYKGNKNQTSFPEFVDLCKLTQEGLKAILPLELMAAGYTDVVKGDGYIYAKGNVPVLLTAHMDTVHKQTIRDFYEYVNEKGQHVLSSPQGIGGDDRCGIYMILEIIKEHKCSVLFCEDEEIGGIGSTKFCKTELINELADLRYLIELDRANGKDAVFYDCDNPEFTHFITSNTGYKEAFGSFSDISTLAPACGVAAVNLSCGYYHAHTLGEEVVVEEMLNTIEVVKKLLTVECDQFEFIEAKYGWGYDSYGNYYGSGYGYGNLYNSGYGYRKSYEIWDDDEEIVVLYVTFYDGVSFKEKTEHYTGETKDAAWVKFFKANPDTCWNWVIDYEFDYIRRNCL